jgi:PAS domain S-box-containing protein
MTARDGRALPGLSDATNGIHVLHVDDDPDFAEMACEFLERESDRITAHAATSADDGLAYLAEADVDCVVSDYRMPGTDGLDLLEAVRADHPELPFILFTGEGSEGLASEAVSAGVTDYFRKESGTEQFAVLANRVVDAVERRRQQRALRRERDRFATLFDEFPEPTLAYAYEDGEPYVRGVNEAFEDLFGFEAADVVGEHVDDLVVPPDRREEAEEIDERVREGEHVDRELRRRTADGVGDFWFRNIQVHDDPDLDGFAVYSDVSERRDRERELRQKVERLDGFASIVSHDLRNPLNVAQGRLDLARRERDADRDETGGRETEREAGDDEHLAAVDRAHERMDRLVETLLALARHGETVDDTSAVDLGTLARSCWARLETADAELEIADDVTVRADENLLDRAVENVLRNSVEHGSTSSRASPDDAVEHGSTSPRSQGHEDAAERGSAGESGSPGPTDGGAATARDTDPADGATVTVTVGGLDDGFFVEDDGPGIPPADRDRVFDGGYSTSRDGTGFGLRIVKDVADAHGWTVGVTEGRDGGARFEFEGVETE